MGLTVRDGDGSVRFAVRVQPRASRSKVVEVEGVTAAAVLRLASP